MAHQKRPKTSANTGKKQAAAKKSLKKKNMASVKSKNDNLREVLDRQASALQAVHGISQTQPRPHLRKTTTDNTPSVNDVASILRNL